MKDFSGDIKFFTEQEKYYAALGFEHLAESFKRASVSLGSYSNSSRAGRRITKI